MPIQFVQGNVLDATTDGLILTIDGARKGLEGNISRAFAQRWPDDFAEIEDQIRYPVPLGKVVATRPDIDSPFKVVYVASTLHHLEILTDQQKVGIIVGALLEIVRHAMQHQIHSLASAVMTGGWRLPFEPAVGAMLDVLRSLAAWGTPLAFYLYVLTERELETARTIAQFKGISLPENKPRKL